MIMQQMLTLSRAIFGFNNFSDIQPTATLEAALASHVPLTALG